MKNAVTAVLRACGKAARLPANFLNHIAGAYQFEGNCIDLAQSARSKPIAFQAIRFKQKGRRPDSYQPGATRQVERKQLFKG
jgi:hypothetical protein